MSPQLLLLAAQLGPMGLQWFMDFEAARANGSLTEAQVEEAADKMRTKLDIDLTALEAARDAQRASGE